MRLLEKRGGVRAGACRGWQLAPLEESEGECPGGPCPACNVPVTLRIQAGNGSRWGSLRPHQLTPPSQFPAKALPRGRTHLKPRLCAPPPAQGDFAPSDLLCPKNKCWVPLDRVQASLEKVGSRRQERRRGCWPVPVAVACGRAWAWATRLGKAPSACKATWHGGREGAPAACGRHGHAAEPGRGC